MRIFAALFLLVSSQAFAGAYTLGETAIYKYDQKLSTESDFRYQHQKIVEVSDDGNQGLVAVTETVGLYGPVVGTDQWWNDYKSVKNYKCDETQTLSVPAGNFPVCMDFQDPHDNGIGLYIDLSLNWLFVRTRFRVCEQKDNCQIFNLDLVSYN